MGEYITNRSCPRCNSDNCEEWGRTNTQEFFIGCPDCGYEYRFNWKRDGNGDFILENPTKVICLKNFVPVITEIKDPYGYFTVKKIRGVSYGGVLKDLEEYNNFQKGIKEQLPKGNISEVLISRYLDGRIIRKKFKNCLLSENEDLWDYCKEFQIPDPLSCSYCENQMEDVNWVILGEKLCPECFARNNDQSEKECIESEIEYQLILNQLNENKQTKND